MLRNTLIESKPKCLYIKVGDEFCLVLFTNKTSKLSILLNRIVLTEHFVTIFIGYIA